ncbi:hypothetical protein EHI47_33045 [Rhizobium leguminosarum]|uniref:Uncharacterized protein n=1 Tax=Rhizobium leguminosarum TaxID=384 RepID=A0A444HL29_RHILE|nr:hypothetical protein [Rhizobium leguminosarum]RWX22644.1 hypothetical protein EHI47_33045 [Rhizobium leguminosarum]UIK01320.1 hypothetical protein LZK82_25110 [Rhizobium leguminosarum]UIK14233.1 hypothetical protein LZK80_30750 [Rhizobium leguminosarum]UIL30357.1 hypothetical protein LZK75_25435 [Rhizobium leguminosarum]WFT90655.1 hypothetical protein QA638_37195 [Rhizobium leguminosarum]
MTEAKSGIRVTHWRLVQEPKDSKAICPAERETLPIGTNAGQNLTEPKEKPPNGGVLPLAFFHWRQTMTELANFIRLNEDGTYLDGVVRWRLC